MRKTNSFRTACGAHHHCLVEVADQYALAQVLVTCLLRRFPGTRSRHCRV